MIPMMHRVHYNLVRLEARRKALQPIIDDKEAALQLVRDSNRIIDELETPSEVCVPPHQQSGIEFSMQEELNRLHFQLDVILALIAKLTRLSTRSCTTCDGIHTVTYSPDGKDQIHPVTTACPTCKGVSTPRPIALAPQPNGC